MGIGIIPINVAKILSSPTLDERRFDNNKTKHLLPAPNSSISYDGCGVIIRENTISETLLRGAVIFKFPNIVIFHYKH